MMRIETVLAAALIVLSAGWLVAADAKQPNIVVILADDFGVGDIQAHFPENKIATPHLDRLVRQGMSFTDAHSGSAVCTPTRYGLLTGRYCWRTRLQEWVIACYEPPLIDADRLTLPGFLSQQGYATACIGKWHLGWEWPGPQPSRMVGEPNAQWKLEWDFTKPIRGGPIDRGFDYFFGIDLPNLPPFTFIENDRIVEQPTSQYEFRADEGVVMPRSFSGAPMAPGWRFDRILPEITERAVRYVHQQAGKEAPFFLYFSMTSPHEPVVPSADFAGRSGIAPIADFVMETDWSAGQVIQAIDEAGIADETIVVFTADNGHSHYTGWDDLVAAGHLPSGPYRGHKGDIWEGGHRVPFVVRWPGRVDEGGSSGQLVCLNDLFATCADVVGGDVPDDAAEDSFSILPTLLNAEPAEEHSRTNIVHHSVNGEFAYRDGPWKIVFRQIGRNLAASRGKPTVVELYNLDEDIAEESDVAEAQPDVAKRLSEGFRGVIESGRSRAGGRQPNDAPVRFDVMQSERWAPGRGEED